MPTDLQVRPAFRESSYRRYVFGEAASVIGDQVWFVALSWAAVQVASPTTAGVVLTVSAVPRLVLMILGGPLADRFDARKIMISSDVLRAAVMFVAAGVVLKQSSIAVLVVISLVFGAVDAVFMPAAGSLRPRLLQPAQLASGAALRELAIRAALALGAPLGGALMTFGNLSVACLVNGATFVVSMLALRALHPRALSPKAAVREENYRRSLVDGLRFLVHSPVLRGVLVVALLVNLAFVGPMNIGLALLSQDRGWGASGVGTLLAGFGIGAALGALTMLRTRATRGIGLWIALGCLLEGIALSALAVATEFIVALSATALIGLVSGPLGILASALTQSATPDEFRGRVSSVNMMVTLGITPLSVAMLGVLADRLGTSAAIIACAPLAGLGAVLCVALPELRRAGVQASVPITTVSPNHPGRPSHFPQKRRRGAAE